MSSTPVWLTAEYIQKFLDSFNDEELKIKDFEVTPGCVAGDGFLSQVFRIKINATKKNISVIAKVLLSSEAVDKIENAVNAFDKEKLVLQNFLPRSLSKLPKPDRFFPLIYYADDEHRALFLEDLCEDRYQLADHKGNGLDLQHSLLVMEALAKLHGTSYLVFKDDPSLTKKFDKYFDCEENRDFMDELTQHTHGALMEVLDDWDLPEECKKKWRNADWTSQVIKTWERKDGQFNVLIQMDPWLNNLMFKYNENGVESMKMIDFQMSTYHSFAFDLHCFIFSSTDSNVKTNHINTLIDRYYEVFTSITGNIPDFSKERLWKEFHEKLFIGFLTLISFAPVLLAPPESKPTDFEQITSDESKISMIEIFRSPKFRDCVEKLLPYFLKYDAV